jgi:hypothetical protein
MDAEKNIWKLTNKFKYLECTIKSLKQQLKNAVLFSDGEEDHTISNLSDNNFDTSKIITKLSRPDGSNISNRSMKIVSIITMFTKVLQSKSIRGEMNDKSLNKFTTDVIEIMASHMIVGKR